MTKFTSVSTLTCSSSNKIRDDGLQTKFVLNYALITNNCCIRNISAYNHVFFLAMEYGVPRKLRVKNLTNLLALNRNLCLKGYTSSSQSTHVK